MQKTRTIILHSMITIMISQPIFIMNMFGLLQPSITCQHCRDFHHFHNTYTPPHHLNHWRGACYLTIFLVVDPPLKYWICNRHLPPPSTSVGLFMWLLINLFIIIIVILIIIIIVIIIKITIIFVVLMIITFQSSSPKTSSSCVSRLFSCSSLHYNHQTFF